MLWLLFILLVIALAAYFRLKLQLWSGLLLFSLLLVQALADISNTAKLLLWLCSLLFVVPLNIKPLRQALISRRLYGLMKKLMPRISQTEQEALDAGDVWWEAELFSGIPDFDKVRALPAPTLNPEEQAFLDGPVEEFCAMLDDWQITAVDYDLSEQAWQYARDNGFFAMIIPKQYGGLEFSAYAHSEVVMKIGSRSGSAAVTVMVPNSLGPGKLLLHYGTEEQKQYYLPRLARGEDIPCFALTGPWAGSDAGAMPDTGVVCRGDWQGRKNVLGIRLNFEKRYITLAPVATLIGLAFKLYDPEHLLGEEEERGITLALIQRDTPGMEIGRRHFPANQAFLNGPIRGHDVFIPLDAIIGGEDCIGKGWAMLMECLGDGRAISLPALGTAAAKMAAKYTGAYARIRQQFHTPIGYFEGVEEVLAEIAGQTYAIDAARLLVLSALDQGAVPSVISGVVKQQLMERMRQVVNDAMDVHGGHAICMGPHNFIGRGYQLIPVGITVEGANILTRSMMIFGQGAMRSHPFLLKEVAAVHHENSRQGLIDFDDALFKHIGFVISNLLRSFWLGLSGARFVSAPGDRNTSYYYRQMMRMSAAFAFVSDVCFGLLGGTLKRREKISGRLADVLSNLYIMTAALQHYENQGSQEDDLALLQWVCEDSLFNIQCALKGVMRNLPVPVIGALVNIIVFPLGKRYRRPCDRLGRKAARLLLAQGEALERLSHGLYASPDKRDATGRIQFALDKVLQSSNLQRKLRGAYKQGQIRYRDARGYDEALEKNIISEDEHALLVATDAAIREAIKVDEFEFQDRQWRVVTP